MNNKKRVLSNETKEKISKSNSKPFSEERLKIHREKIAKNKGYEILTKEFLIQKHYIEKLAIRQIAILTNIWSQTIIKFMKFYDIEIIDGNKLKKRPEPTSNLKFLTKELAYELYVTKRLSSLDIGKIINYHEYSKITKRIKKFGIPVRHGKEASTENTTKKLKSRNYKPTRETIDKISKKLRGRKQTKEEIEKRAKSLRGPNNPLWKGNRTLIDQIRKCYLYSDWRLSVFQRDDFTCKICGGESHGNINADHIKPFSLILHENNIKTIDQAITCEQLWDINNGQTLCVECHKKTDTYGEKAKKLMKYKEEQISLRELANRIGIEDLNTPEIYDITHKNYDILSYDEKRKKQVWKSLKNFVVKPQVEEHYQINTLHGTSNHKIYMSEDMKYIHMKDYPGAELVKIPMQVVDLEVEDTHNYIAEGFVNHNTTPGGLSIPYVSSVRVRYTSTGQSQIKDAKGNAIGIKVKAKTIKNKVARPFRECEFNIYFGKGIVEHEEIFDVLREYCDKNEVRNNKGELICISGAGAWKTFTVTDSNGEIKHEIKCYKPDFGDRVLNVPVLKEYVDFLMDTVYILKSNDDNHPTIVGPDLNSVEEVSEITGRKLLND